jgi:hypothetical protein
MLDQMRWDYLYRYYDRYSEKGGFKEIVFSLEEAMEYIKEDEYLEVTPQSLRMRKIKYQP